MTHRERAERLFASWCGKVEPFVDAAWMNPEDKEPFIAGIAQAIADATRPAVQIRDLDTIDTCYCGHCERDTRQECHDSGHERDSSNDRQECLECGWVYLGMTGRWQPPMSTMAQDIAAQIEAGGRSQPYGN